MKHSNRSTMILVSAMISGRNNAVMGFLHQMGRRSILDSSHRKAGASPSPWNRSPFLRNVHISATMDSQSTYEVRLRIPTAEDLEDVGAIIGVCAKPPDTILLDGDLGAGKTTFAKGFVSCKLGVEDMHVTSPTYLLSNTYCFQDEKSGKDCEIHHMDLYRLAGTSPNDFEPLRLKYVFENCISLIEWPSRLEGQPQLMPHTSNRLDIRISIEPRSDDRLMTLTAPDGSTWNGRLESLVENGMIEDLLTDNDDVVDEKPTQ